MKKIPILSNAILCGLILSIVPLSASADAMRVANLTELKAKQKKSPTATVYLVTGTDSDPVLSTKAIKQWKSPLFDKAADGMNLFHINYLDHGKDGAKGTQLDPKNKGFLLRPRIYHIPVLIMHDAKGLQVGRIDGYNASKESMTTAIKGWQKIIVKRDALLGKAHKAKGISKAKYLGQAIDAIYDSKLLKEIKKVDPKDTLGYVTKYTMRPEKISQAARSSGKRRQWDNVDAQMAQIDKYLKIRVITTHQRQALLVARSAHHMYMRNNKKRYPNVEADRIKTLKEIVKLDPDSKYGQGARGLLMREDDLKKNRDLRSKLKSDPDNRKLLEELIALHKESGYFLGERSARGEHLYPMSVIGFDGKVSVSSMNRKATAWEINLIGHPNISGYARTNKELNPWVNISFDKPRLIAHISAVFKRPDCPVVFEVSNDDKTWRKVGEIRVRGNVTHARLNKSVKVKHVRCRYTGTGPYELRLCNLWIYGMAKE